MISLRLFTDLSKEEWDALSEYKKKEIRVKHFIEQEIYLDPEWVLAYKEWLDNGQIGEEPKQHFDYMKSQFDGCDMYNAFMKGAEFAKDLLINNYSQ